MVFPGSAENKALVGLIPCWSTRLQGLLQGVKGVTIYLQCSGCGFTISLEPPALAAWTALGACRAWLAFWIFEGHDNWSWERDRRAELADGEMRGRERRSVPLIARELLAWLGHLTNPHSSWHSWVKWAKYELLMLHLTSCFKTAWTYSKVHVNILFFWCFWNGGKKSTFIRCSKNWGSLVLAGTEQEGANPKPACEGEVWIVYALFSHKSSGKVKGMEMTLQMGNQLPFGPELAGLSNKSQCLLQESHQSWIRLGNSPNSHITGKEWWKKNENYGKRLKESSVHPSMSFSKKWGSCKANNFRLSLKRYYLGISNSCAMKYFL